jgi:methylmalonyl-CoA mutase
MAHLAEALHVLKDFPPVPTNAWEAAIHIDLKGEDYNKKLVWNSDEGIVVRPYYRSEDIKDLESQIGKVPATFPFVRGRGSQSWKQVESQGEVAADGIRVDAIHEQGGTIVQELGYGIALGPIQGSARTARALPRFEPKTINGLRLAAGAGPAVC